MDVNLVDLRVFGMACWMVGDWEQESVDVKVVKLADVMAANWDFLRGSAKVDT